VTHYDTSLPNMISQQSPANVSVSAGRRDENRHMAWICLVLAAITFAVFGQTLHHGFIDFDDNAYVYSNRMVTQGLTLKGLVWVFTHADCSLYHPLTMLSLMADCQLYGLHAGGYHFTNVLLHTASVILLFLILRQMTGALWRSAFVAAVFAIHPLRVESVAWVSERKDVLSGLFFMLTLGAYVRYARRPWSWGRYGLVILSFAMGLMCKPILVTLPVVLLLLDYWPLQRVEPAGKLVLEKLPLLALSAGMCALTFLATRTASASLENIPVPSRLGNALVSYAIYLRQMVWPAGLAVPYPHNYLPPWEVALAGVLLAGLSSVAWGQQRKQPWLLMGWLWYLVMLLPVAGILLVGSHSHADRYTYLPQIGIYVAVTWLMAEWGAKLHVGRVAMGGLMIAVPAVLMFCAWKQAAYWKNEITLWSHALACTTRNYKAHYGLGNALSQTGRVDEAISQYQMALQIRPDYADARASIGLSLFKEGKPDEAIRQFRKALQIQPDHVNAHNGLGIALFQEGSVDEAIIHFQKALQSKPDNVNARNNLGIALAEKGRTAEAIAQYQRALQIQPVNPETQNNLAWLLATCPEAPLRDGNKAVELARQANELTGGENPVMLQTLAAALAETGRFPEAVETSQRALRLAEAQSNTGLAGQIRSALQLFQAGCPYHGQ
jgi:protein O-mannosyl-transferase